MSNSKSTVSIDQLVSRIVRLQDPETDYLFTGDPASFDFADLEFMQDDIQRRIVLAQKRKAAPGEVDKLNKEKLDIEHLIDFAGQLKNYLNDIATTDLQGRSDSTLVFDHSIHPGDVYQHPDSRIVKYSAHQFAKKQYDIEIANWDLPAPTRSADTALFGQQTLSSQPTVPIARSAQTQVDREDHLTESNSLLPTLSWFLDLYMEKKHSKCKEMILDPNCKTSSPILRAGQLNIDAVSRSLAAEIDMPGDIARAVKNYVKMALEVILNEGSIQAPISPRQAKGAYRTLYGLARLTLRTLLADDHKFTRIENSPQEVASFFTGKFPIPEPLSKDEVTACLSECWEIVTELIQEKKP